MNAINKSSTITEASRQWSRRPDDERYTSLLDMQKFFTDRRDASRAKVISSRKLAAEPDPNNNRDGLVVTAGGSGANVTNWSFSQLAKLSGAPASYLSKLPAPIAADCVNYGLHHARDVEEIGVLLTKTGDGVPTLRAATGPNYGRVWNGGPDGVVDALVEKFGDGVNGQWRVPGEFGKRVEVSKSNTTLYASDRDMFVFLADEENRIEIPNRRAGMHGDFARGFYVWNSEEGGTSLGAAFFLYDYVCCNRIIWGAEQFHEVRIRHTSGAPDRWLEDVTPILVEYSNSKSSDVTRAIEAARSKKLDDVDAFLAKRFGAKQVHALRDRHVAEEGRPIETLWDVATAVTAHARDIRHQDTRVDLEREAGKLLAMAQ